MEIEKLKSIIESILFVCGEPVKISKIIKAVELPKPEVENALMMLRNDYAKMRGLSLIIDKDIVQMVSNAENSQYVSVFVKGEMQDNLSQAALEVLSIIAYKGPIGRAGIEMIRGVNSSYTLRSLLMRGLIEREENPDDSRAYVYRVSFDFLRKLGLDSIDQLPDWNDLSQDKRIENILGNN
jgi:segregation and condensation protein B